MTENTRKKICAVLSFCLPLLDLLFFKFLLAIVYSRYKMFIDGEYHRLFQFFNGYGFHHVGIRA